ncbi:hypothetical protein [Streptomyces sp. MNP-20]|uniref:hypothetical protein n=1 Tax=Streptomyces sp. MNP-20 TaxID=2721165 RepID=UPI001557BDC4|nr:hypothetical protein [Streptomyces sp. MNP-20]
MSLLDPCPLADRQVCQATRGLARAILRRLGHTAARVEPRIRTIIVTRADAPSRHVLWRLHGDDGRLLLQFDLLRAPGAAWDGLAADAAFLAALVDLRVHPPGYYYVHPMPDPRDLAIPLPVNPRGLPPRAVGPLAGLPPSGEVA